MNGLKIKNLLLSLGIIVFASGVFATVVPQTTYAAEDSCTSSFLGFPAWYKGLIDSDCNIVQPNGADSLRAFILTIIMNILNIGLHIAGYVAVFFIIYGGFQYMISRGNAQNTAKAQKTIRDAVIGLVLSILSVLLVSYISSGLGMLT